MSDTAYSGAQENAQIHLAVPECCSQLWLFDELIPTPTRMADIAAEVAKLHGVTVSDIRGQRRFRVIAHARQEFYWRARQVFRENGKHRHSYPAIGRWCGGRDHTTAIHGFRRHKERMAKT